MDFWKSFLNLARRGYIGLPVLGLALIAGGLTYMAIPAHYVSSASMVLTTPAGGGSQSQDPKKYADLTNPLLQFNDSLRTTAGIIILAMTTPEAAAQVGVVQGSGTTLTVNDGHTNPDLLAVSNNGPFIYIQVDSLSSAAATETVAKAEQLVRDQLSQRQRVLNAPKSTYISITEVAPPTTPKAKRTAKWGAAAAALLGVIIAGFGIAYTVERARSERTARRVQPKMRFRRPLLMSLQRRNRRAVPSARTPVTNVPAGEPERTVQPAQRAWPNPDTKIQQPAQRIWPNPDPKTEQPAQRAWPTPEPKTEQPTQQRVWQNDETVPLPILFDADTDADTETDGAVDEDGEPGLLVHQDGGDGREGWDRTMDNVEDLASHKTRPRAS
jgi:hypothetical protein